MFSWWDPLSKKRHWWETKKSRKWRIWNNNQEVEEIIEREQNTSSFIIDEIHWVCRKTVDSYKTMQYYSFVWMQFSFRSFIWFVCELWRGSAASVSQHVVWKSKTIGSQWLWLCGCLCCTVVCLAQVRLTVGGSLLNCSSQHGLSLGYFSNCFGWIMHQWMSALTESLERFFSQPWCLLLCTSCPYRRRLAIKASTMQMTSLSIKAGLVSFTHADI